MRPVFLVLCILFGSILTASRAIAQDTAKHQINADLSDETEETEIVEKGAWQVEAGLLCNDYRSENTSLIAQVMLRYGITDRIELRAIAEEGRNRDFYIEETVQSTFPMALGTKLVLLEEQPVLPDISLLTYINLPWTAKTEGHSKYWSPMFMLAFQNGNDRWKVDYNIGCQQEAFSRDWALLGNASFHYSVTESLEGFVEYFSQFQAGEGPSHNVGLGGSYQIGEVLSVYLTVGTTVDREQYNRFGAAGLAVAFR